MSKGFEYVMTMPKEYVRYNIKWEVKNNGMCVGQVRRDVFQKITDLPIETSEFQITVEKHVIGMKPVEGQKVFKNPQGAEHEKLVAIARAYYAGVNKNDAIYYWELDGEEPKETVRSQTTGPLQFGGF